MSDAQINRGRVTLGQNLRIRYDTIEEIKEINVDSKAEYTA